MKAQPSTLNWSFKSFRLPDDPPTNPQPTDPKPKFK
jgi:hypothetical protein